MKNEIEFIVELLKDENISMELKTKLLDRIVEVSKETQKVFIDHPPAIQPIYTQPHSSYDIPPLMNPLFISSTSKNPYATGVFIVEQAILTANTCHSNRIC